MLIIEGTDDAGNYAPDGVNPPFAVFNPDKQDWEVANLPSREAAEKWKKDNAQRAPVYRRPFKGDFA